MHFGQKSILEKTKRQQQQQQQQDIPYELTCHFDKPSLKGQGTFVTLYPTVQ